VQVTEPTRRCSAAWHPQLKPTAHVTAAAAAVTGRPGLQAHPGFDPCRAHAVDFFWQLLPSHATTPDPSSTSNSMSTNCLHYNAPWLRMQCSTTRGSPCNIPPPPGGGGASPATTHYQAQPCAPTPNPLDVPVQDAAQRAFRQQGGSVLQHIAVPPTEVRKRRSITP
jgi:hypothetical protein